MNKRQKIVVSITGITLVLLILVGLTYAYFLTRIQGNTNTKSISVTTADLRIVYADGNQNVITKNKIIPGTVIGEKDFTVTNEGNSEADYIVVIDDVVINNVTSSDSTTFNSNDFVYTLTCVSKNKNTGDVSGTCDGVSSETELPLYNDGLLVSNKIAENIRHEYVLTVTYKETNVDQSADMNKKLEAKVDIKDIKSLNPYSDNQNSLAYNIINNAMLKKNGTELRAIPLTKPAEEASIPSEKELSITPDDYGTSYYYRGAVSDNYVDFAGYCWRVVRIQGDGSVKLILASKNGLCETINIEEDYEGAVIGYGDYGYKELDGKYYVDYDNAQSTTSQKYIMNIFLNGGTIDNTTYPAFSSSNLSKLKSEQICIGDSSNAYDDQGNLLTAEDIAEIRENYGGFWYDTYKRLAIAGMYAPSLKCTSAKASSSKIYPLTADEVTYAGVDYYAYGNSFDHSNHYLYASFDGSWMTISHIGYFTDGDYDLVATVDSGVYIEFSMSVNSENLVRPAVSLISGTTISGGVGTKTNPYVIN